MPLENVQNPHGYRIFGTSRTKAENPHGYRILQNAQKDETLPNANTPNLQRTLGREYTKIGDNLSPISGSRNTTKLIARKMGVHEPAWLCHSSELRKAETPYVVDYSVIFPSENTSLYQAFTFPSACFSDFFTFSPGGGLCGFSFFSRFPRFFLVCIYIFLVLLKRERSPFLSFSLF